MLPLSDRSPELFPGLYKQTSFPTWSHTCLPERWDAHPCPATVTLSMQAPLWGTPGQSQRVTQEAACRRHADGLAKWGRTLQPPSDSQVCHQVTCSPIISTIHEVKEAKEAGCPPPPPPNSPHGAGCPLARLDLFFSLKAALDVDLYLMPPDLRK